MDTATKYNNNFVESSDRGEQKNQDPSTDGKQRVCFQQSLKKLFAHGAHVAAQYGPYGSGRKVRWRKVIISKRRYQPQVNKRRPQQATKASDPPIPAVVHKKVLTPSPPQSKQSGERPQQATKASDPPLPAVVHKKVLTPSSRQLKQSGPKTGKNRGRRKRTERRALCYHVRLVRNTYGQGLRKRICDQAAEPDPSFDHTTIDNTLMVSGLDVEDSDSDDDGGDYQRLCLYRRTNQIIDVIIPEDRA